MTRCGNLPAPATLAQLPQLQALHLDHTPRWGDSREVGAELQVGRGTGREGGPAGTRLVCAQAVLTWALQHTCRNARETTASNLQGAQGVLVGCALASSISAHPSTAAVPPQIPATFGQAALEPLTQLTHLVCAHLRALPAMPPALAQLAELQSFGWVTRHKSCCGWRENHYTKQQCCIGLTQCLEAGARVR